VFFCFSFPFQRFCNIFFLEDELSKIVTDFRPNVEERKRLETLRNEKAGLRRRIGELEAELTARETFCANLQKKAADDSRYIGRSSINQ
jgi:hypothetical protein